MELLESLYNEIIGFLGISQAWEILKTGNYAAFRTYDGIASLYPIIPLLLVPRANFRIHLQKATGQSI